jgi:hypothetical protein
MLIAALSACISRHEEYNTTRMTLRSDSNRRKSFRVPAKIYVEARPVEKFSPLPPHAIFTENLSKGGFAFWKQAPIEPGQRLSLKIHLPTSVKPIEMVGEVKRSVPQPESPFHYIAVEFVDKKHDSIGEIVKYVVSSTLTSDDATALFSR